MEKGNFKVIDYIFQTEDYDLFSYVPTNRDVTERKQLEESIIEHGLLVPIKVTKDFEILDGQHRFEGCRKTNTPVKFYFSEKGGITEIIEENSNRSNWAIYDYAKSYAASGNEEYTKLLPFLKEGKVPSNALISIANGYLFGTATVVIKNFKKGKFYFLNYQMFSQFYDFLLRLNKDFKVDLSGTLVNAIYQMYTQKNFSSARLQKFFAKQENVSLINGTRGQSNILENLVLGYNSRLDEASDTYLKNSYRGNNRLDKFIVMTGELKNWAKK